MTDAPLHVCSQAVCPRKKWGRGKVKRQIGAGAGLIFKGSGFYITDYRSETYKAAAQKESGPSASPAKASAPAESKPAAPKSDSKPASGAAKAKT